MPDSGLDLDGLLQAINAEHGIELSLHGRYPGGENQGAFRMVTSDGESLVLKRAPAEPGVIARLERARAITARLHDLGAPVPRYVLLGTTPDSTLYSLQTALPGQPAGRLI